MKYKILFIDEEKSAHRIFKNNFLEQNKERFSGEYVVPKATLEEMMDLISEKMPDIVLTDFSLNEKKTDLPSPYTVEYNGGDIANELLARRKNFPVFIATNLGDDAARGGYDVKLIYEKAGSFRENQNESTPARDAQHLTFSDRVYYEVTAYKKSINDASSKFDELIEKKNSGNELTLSEEQELATLDEFLESTIDSRSKLPRDLRSTSTIQKLDSLISLAEQLLERNKTKS